jgi:hypothetical protein
MVHYHGGPFSDMATSILVWRGRLAMISYARPERIKTAADVCQSFCLDNGAYSVWRRGMDFDTEGFYQWVAQWIRHPGCDFAIVPDRIDGSESDNDRLLRQWPFERWHGCPVWHMHERLSRLARLSREWPRVTVQLHGGNEAKMQRRP